MNEPGNEGLTGLWCCLMERRDSIGSHSPSGAECPERPSAAMGEVTDTTQSPVLSVNHREI